MVARSSGPILIVGHAGVNRVLLCHVLGMPLDHLFRVGQDHAALNIITAREAVYRVTLMNMPAEWTARCRTLQAYAAKYDH